MDKFIGSDIDHKHTVACVVQPGQPNRYRKLRTEVAQLREWLEAKPGRAGFARRASPEEHISTMFLCTEHFLNLQGLSDIHFALHRSGGQ